MEILRERKLRNSEIIQFINDAILICEQNEEVQLALQPRSIPLKSILNSMNEASLTKDIGLSAQLLGFDKSRDSLFIGFKFNLKGATHHWDPTVVEAAKSTLAFVDRHIKNIRSLNYQAETEKLTALVTILKDLESKKGVLTTLNLLDWVLEIEKQNNLFNELYIIRTNTDSENSLPSVTNLREEAFSKYKDLIELLNSRIVIKKVEGLDYSEFEKVRNSISILISKYNDIENLRK